MIDVAGLFVFGGGTAAVMYSRVLAERARRSQFWPSVRGRVTRSEVVRRRGSNNGYRAEIEYVYTVDREYRSSTLCIGGTLDTGKGRARERCAKYPLGAEVEVVYDPSNPATACLERTAEGARLMSWIGYGAMVVGALSLLGAINL